MKKIIVAVLLLSALGATAQNGNRQNKTVIKKQQRVETKTNNASTTGETRGAYKGSTVGQTKKEMNRNSGNMNKTHRSRHTNRRADRIDTSGGL